MANLPEPPEWPDGVYQIETPDPVLGGPDGIANKAAKALASRTVWLKAKFEGLVEGTVIAFKATRLATARKLSISGAASGNASFDGSADANIAITLADSGVTAGVYQKVTVNVKGLVIDGGALSSSDIPDLDWSKIKTGKPTTLGGYGITDALGISGTALAARKLETARNISITGAASGSASFDGSASANISLTLADSGVAAGAYTKVTVNAKGLVIGTSALTAADIPSLDWSKIGTGKPTTLAGYGIADAYTTAGTQWVVSQAITDFSATKNLAAPAFLNGFYDANTSRYWTANGNLYVSIDFARGVALGAQSALLCVLPPGARPRFRCCGTGDWVTSSPLAFGYLSWSLEINGYLTIDLSVGATNGAGGYQAQIHLCTQLA
ncbi:hypothetical protein [Pseudomonas sp. BGI-2]|uniref:hypothetical protein n=1 Tax=Pseudomonas sp. BGI-2 TaxID=2528211 RepID=UPI00211446D9|nr:hypothetical protein [Pseudomonas sp. BGI-2]